MNSTWRSSMLLALGFALMAAACARETTTVSGPRAPMRNLPVVEVYRSASCECCGKYVAYLEDQGFEVRTVIEEDRGPLSGRLGIPAEMSSCHTSMVEGYFVEGHAPVEAIHRLLEDRPDVDGIALPGMPPGSPGMGGRQEGPLTVYAITNGVATEFMVFAAS